MKLYKVIKDNKSCHGGSFDWTEYLPKDDGPGKWTPIIENISECETGYHVTPHWNMWAVSGCTVYECECKGLVKPVEDVGVIDKYVCKSVRLIKMIGRNTGNRNTGYQNTGNRNTGDWNTGDQNTGNWNTGYQNTGSWNTGNWNTGDRNAGNLNTGDLNTGDRNTGNRNTGYWNTGNLNTGDRNTGYRNTGYQNTGNLNTGYWNTGNLNTGNWNTGYRNTGDWNTGDLNTGCFNTGIPQYIELFNKPVAYSIYERIKFPRWLYHSGNWIVAFNEASIEEIKATVELPNFDYIVFEEITGITKDMILERIK